MASKKFIRILSILVILMGLFVASCKSQPTEPEIQVEDVWGRPSPMSASLGAFYMNIKNTGSQADKLLSAESQACGVIEIHETVQQGDTMGMRPVEGGFVDIPPGETVEFKTGGLHLMCIDKKDDFTPGVKIPLVLKFKTSGSIEQQVEIRNP